MFQIQGACQSDPDPMTNFTRCLTRLPARLALVALWVAGLVGALVVLVGSLHWLDVWLHMFRCISTFCVFYASLEKQTTKWSMTHWTRSNPENGWQSDGSRFGLAEASGGGIVWVWRDS